jgi:hypothetical protein
MRSCIKFLLITSLAIILSQIPLQATQADSGKSCATGKDQPIWQIYKPGKAQSVCWKYHKANRRFRIYKVGTSDPSDDLVWDQETDLVWVRAPSTLILDFWGAANHCNRSKYGGRYGWRSPTVEEAGTLLDDTTDDKLPVGHPFLVTMPFYWTSTTNPADPGGSNARGLDLANAALTISPKTGGGSPWCVRGGVGHEAKYMY